MDWRIIIWQQSTNIISNRISFPTQFYVPTQKLIDTDKNLTDQNRRLEFQILDSQITCFLDIHLMSAKRLIRSCGKCETL